jgi:hypothetical protein
MAISTNGAIITRLAGALYGEYLSNASYTELSTTAPATVAANFLSNDFAGKTDAQIATTVLTNLSLNTVAGLDNWVAAQLTAAGSTAAAKGAKLVSMLNDYSQMTADATYGTSATSFNAKVAAALTLSQTAGNAGGAFGSAGTANGSFSLTTGLDSFAGGSGNDRFVGSIGNTDPTLSTGDEISGGDGTDTLQINASGSSATTVGGLTLTSVETVSIVDTNSAGTTVNLAGNTGITTLKSAGSSGAALSFSNVPAIATLDLSYTAGSGTATVGYTTAASTGTNTQAITLTEAGATGTVTIAGVEVFNVASSGTSTLQLVAASGTTVNVTASGTTTIDLDSATNVALTTVSGGTSTGTITWNLDTDYTDMNVTGGAGNDTFDISAGAPGLSDAINGGDGTDTLYFATAATGTTDTTAIATTTASFSNIEKLSLRAQDNGAAGSALDITVDMDTTEGVTSVTLSARDTETANIFTLNDLTATQAAAISLSTFTSGVGATLNLDLADGSGAADVAKVTSTAVSTGSTITINDAGNAGAIEALEVTLSGAYTSTLTIETAEFDDSIKISGGTAGVAVDGNGAALTSDVVDLSGFAGNINIALGANDQEVTGGTGNDTFEFGANLTRNDVIDGGAGTDVLQIMPSGSISGALDISNVETLQVEASASGSANFSGVTGIVTVDLDSGTSINSIVLTAQNLTGVTSITAVAEGASAAMNGLTITSGFTGTADALTLSLSTVLGAATVGALSLAGLETLTISATGDSDNDAATVGNITATTGLTSVIVKDSGFTASLAAQDVVLGTVGGNTTDAMTSFDASDLVAGLSVTLNSLASSASVVLGDGSDLLSIVGSDGTNLSITSGDGNDQITLTTTAGHTIETGTGDSTIVFGTGGTNVVTLGAGDNTLNFDAAGAVNESSGNTIAGFDTGDLLTPDAGTDTAANIVNAVSSGIDSADLAGDITVFTRNSSVADALISGTDADTLITDYTDVANGGDVEILLELLAGANSSGATITAAVILNDGSNSYYYVFEQATGGDEITNLTLVGTFEGYLFNGSNDISL